MVKGVATAGSASSRSAASATAPRSKGKQIHIALGYSHPVVFELPEGITAEVDKVRAPRTACHHRLTLRSVNRELLGETAAKIRALASARAVQGQGHQVRRRDASAARTARPAPRKRRSRIIRRRKSIAAGRTRNAMASIEPREAEGRIRRKLSRHRRAPAPHRVQEPQAHLRPGRRRHAPARPLAFASTLVQGAQGRGRGRQEGRRQAGRHADRREVQGRQGIDQVVFDRNGFLYHGRVAAVADARPRGRPRSSKERRQHGDSHQSERTRRSATAWSTSTASPRS